jgi:hypothetical protein
MIAAVLHVDEHAAMVLVDRVPFVGGVQLAILLHDRLDPSTNRLASFHGAEHVLDVVGILREQVRPAVPVLADRAGAPVLLKRSFQLFTSKLRHAMSPRRPAASSAGIFAASVRHRPQQSDGPADCETSTPRPMEQ